MSPPKLCVITDRWTRSVPWLRILAQSAPLSFPCTVTRTRVSEPEFWMPPAPSSFRPPVSGQMRHADLARGHRQRRANTLCIQHRRRHALQHEVLADGEGAMTCARDREDCARLGRVDRRLQARTGTTVDRHLRRCQARRRSDQRRCHDARCSQPPTTASTLHPPPPIDPNHKMARDRENLSTWEGPGRKAGRSPWGFGDTGPRPAAQLDDGAGPAREGPRGCPPPHLRTPHPRRRSLHRGSQGCSRTLAGRPFRGTIGPQRKGEALGADRRGSSKEPPTRAGSSQSGPPWAELLEALPAAFYLDRPDGTSVWVSPHLESIIGLTEQEWASGYDRSCRRSTTPTTVSGSSGNRRFLEGDPRESQSDEYRVGPAGRAGCAGSTTGRC